MISRDPSLNGALEADDGLEEELDNDPEEEPEQGQQLKTGFPELEKDVAPSGLLLPASKCISRHSKKLDVLLQRFQKPSEGTSLTDLQSSLLGFMVAGCNCVCGVVGLFQFVFWGYVAEAQGQTGQQPQEASVKC